MTDFCTSLLLTVQIGLLMAVQPQGAGHLLGNVTDTERLWLARAVQGEVSVMGEHRLQAGTWVVHVALSRVDSPWFPGDLVSVVQSGFYGSLVVDTPEPWAYEAVDFALAERACGVDPTQGSLFVFGGLDVLPCMDFSKRLGMLQREGWDFSVHLFRTWPYPKGCWYD
jgi:hypothetical protein